MNPSVFIGKNRAGSRKPDRGRLKHHKNTERNATKTPIEIPQKHRIILDKRRKIKYYVIGGDIMPYMPRIADEELQFRLASAGAVLIEGPKWCGKTTTAMQKAKSTLFMQDPD